MLGALAGIPAFPRQIEKGVKGRVNSGSVFLSALPVEEGAGL